MYMVFFFIHLGYGVFVTEDVPKGRFLVEYAGERITPKEAEERDKKQTSSKPNYIFYFRWNGLKW